MLFTVNVETSTQPYPTILRNLVPGYGIRSNNFTLNKGKIHYLNDLPKESETGLEVIPGRQELDTIIELFPRCVGVMYIKESVILGYKFFNWPGHVFANQPVYVQYTVDRVKPRIGCVDVNWLCELKNNQGQTACRLIIKQRLYT